MKVSQLLDKKGRQVYSIGPDDSVFKALEVMAEKNIGALLVVDNGEIAGIFSERDYARKIILMGRASKGTPVREIMSRDVTTIDPEQTIQDCMSLMTDQRIRHLPVLKEGKVEGMISIGDVVKAIISEQKFHIEQLEGYIQRG